MYEETTERNANGKMRLMDAVFLLETLKKLWTLIAGSLDCTGIDLDQTLVSIKLMCLAIAHFGQQ